MRTTVALVEAQPNTIVEDYRRVMRLAGMEALPDTGTPSVLVGTGATGFEPGWDSPPWQLDAVLGYLGPAAAGARVLAVGSRGGAALPRATRWDDCLARHGAQTADQQYFRLHRHVSQLRHPALDTILPQGVQVPVGLTEGPALLLVTPCFGSGGEIVAAGARLQALVTAGAASRRTGAKSRRTPRAEIVAEAVGVAGELMPELNTVLDGTLWGVQTSGGRKECVARNVLLAGRDPLAVDTVAAQLAGLNPAQIGWLRLCRERGVGHGRASEIRVVGRSDLLGLDFELSGRTFAAGNSGWLRLNGAMARAWERVRPGAKTESLRSTAWAALAEAYAGGESPFETTPAQRD